MDGGLALLGLGLFLLSIANLYARSALGLAGLLLAVSLVSMGMAFSEFRRRREVSLTMGVVLLLGAGVGLLMSVPWWSVLGTFLFAVAYGILWAEFRFTAFGHVTTDEVPHPTHRRWRFSRARRTNHL
ncbi:hypothetical protein STIAU_0859 [Stigmatella aurantiaca DW4/3-1]|uniref:Uncharacterized protein n=1 Tax=Stigmatella aurantiaca (strain DW4/3-1) TaxID=378806 RepID=Q08TC9_STIAD|nr:hypothetical protein STIAU_0859 [Stigmatella aurantiaca DW4/3-1]